MTEAGERLIAAAKQAREMIGEIVSSEIDAQRAACAEAKTKGEKLISLVVDNTPPRT